MELEWFELSRAALVGVSRNVEALRLGCRSSREIQDHWGIHILGACGECAFAKGTGRYWSGGVNTFKDADVGSSIQIRTRSKHDYDLIVRSDDSDDEVFVLVTGGPQVFVLHGWILGRDAKRQQFVANYGNHGEAYFVPQSNLNSIQQLVCY